MILPRCKVGGGGARRKSGRDRRRRERRRKASSSSSSSKWRKSPLTSRRFPCLPLGKLKLFFSGTTCVFRLCSSYIQRVSYGSLPRELGEEGKRGNVHCFSFPPPREVFKQRSLGREEIYRLPHAEEGTGKSSLFFAQKEKALSPALPAIIKRKGGWGIPPLGPQSWEEQGEAKRLLGLGGPKGQKKVYSGGGGRMKKGTVGILLCIGGRQKGRKFMQEK